MANYEIILLGVALAFCWLNINRINMMPFKCMMCMSGWFSLAIGLFVHLHWSALAFFPVGCLSGAIVDNAMRRYL